MIKTNMDSCVQFNHCSYLDPDSIFIICPYCYHQTVYSYNKNENRCSMCSIIINEEDIYVQSED